jgi:uncharacterized SAM-binding protein YcdF (DUF218 family)
MFFTVSKLLGALVNPATLLGILILGSAAAALGRRKRLSAALLGGSAVLVLVFGVLPTAAWMARPLETRFVAPALPDRITGVIVLGGTEMVEQSAAWGQPMVSDPAPIVTLLKLGRRYPDAKLVFTGGIRSRHDKSVSEATVARDFINELDTTGRAIIFEDQARNTYENAIFTRQLVGPKPGERWILVCQAIAMPRAVGVFRKAGWDVVPVPAGYLTAGRDRAFLPFDLIGGFRLAALALHEWVGLIVYRMMGYSDALYPE